MRAIQERPVELRRAFGRILTPGADEFSVAPFVNLAAGSSSGPWLSANDPLAIPFVLRDGVTVTHLGALNGTAAGGGFDIGVYDTAWNRKVSCGTQTGSGNSAWQFIDVTDTPLSPGRYFLVIVRDNVTAGRQFFVSDVIASAAHLGLFGCYDSATDAYPLPDPLTNMALTATFTRVPICGIATRAQY